MKSPIVRLVGNGTKSIRMRQVLTWALLAGFALSASRVDAFYYTTHRSRVRGPSNTSLNAGVGNRSKMQSAGNPNVVGELCLDKDGEVIVRWPVWRTYLEETLSLGRFKSEAEFLKVYVEKCMARDDETDNRRVLDADYEKKRVYKASGKKMWAAYIKALQAARAAERKFLRGLPLESLFGIQIGAPVDVAMYEKTDTANCYAFKPKKQFRKFDAYSFKVTPKSHIVYQIRAKTNTFAAYDEVDEEWNYVKQVFMKKFQKQAARDLPNQKGYSLLFPGAGAGVGREIIIRRSGCTASITAVDLGLAKQAEAEESSQ